MGNHSKLDRISVACGLILAGGLFGARRARADQIVALVDEHGHKVYINVGEPANSPNSRYGSSFRPLRGTNQLLSAEEIDPLVQRAATRNQVDPRLVHAIIQVESEYNPRAVSNKGAMGLMQLVPATAERFGVENPFDPRQNIEAGVTYLRYLLDLFGGDLPLALAAYNAGENSVLRQGGIPSFTETREYVRKVSGLYGGSAVPGKAPAKPAEPAKPPIYRYVDAQGVVHFTNGFEF